jgi:hypothetical protein
MDDAVIVRGFQRIGHLRRVLQGIVQRQAAMSGDPIVESLAFDVLHHEEASTVFVADVVQGADVRMVQTGNGLCFTMEARQPIRIVGEMFGKDFDSDRSSEASVGSLVDLAHSARTDLADDLIWTQARARGKRQMDVLLMGG